MVDAPGARVTSLESSIKHLSPVLISKPNETRMGLYASSEGGVGNICEPAFDRCNFDESFVSLTFFVELIFNKKVKSSKLTSHWTFRRLPTTFVDLMVTAIHYR
eukprot:GHVL01027872.1.p1 GENE.GHVL01027872.1~~GHVL01027872.1.p1  ORF type:complete len:104 (-),score=4.77 GHVL01027872.1:241-552(-)